jgi:ABC-type lipoprotein export system ATPase subunit
MEALLVKSVKIRKLKGLVSLDFEIPGPGVHLLAGSNGSGKTTLLACLRRLCHANSFQLHFLSSLQSNRLDTFNGAEVTYCLGTESVTYAYAGERWVPRPRRSSDLVQKFGYPDVLYVGATASRITPRPEDFSTAKLRPASPTIIQAVNSIFETTRFADLRAINLTTGNRNQAFVLVDRRPGQSRVSYFSEKNFSLGELCVLKLLRELNHCHIGTLVLIDELELALHPRAQVGLIRHLEQLSKEKALTVIVSTHSVTLLKSADRNKITFLEKRENGETVVLQKCFPAYALGGISMSEERSSDAVIYVEDEAARTVTEMLLRLCIFDRYTAMQTAPPTISVLPVGDYNNVVRFLDKNRAVLPGHVKQWILLDKDVEAEIVSIMDASSNNPMRDAFHRNSAHIRYLPFTPEVALMTHLAEKRTEVLTALRQMCLNQQMQLPPSMLTITQTAGPALRQECKRLLRQVIEHIRTETTNKTDESIREFLYESLAKRYFNENKATTMQVFGPILG